MKLTLLRYEETDTKTFGLLFIDGVFQCHTLEDDFDEVKTKGKTRIPAGTYDIDWKSGMTPLTKRYREKFDWFEQHIEIKDIPNYTNVYFHIGNTEHDTAGCPLLGYKVTKDGIQESTKAFEDFYEIVEDELDWGMGLVTLEIIDADQQPKIITNLSQLIEKEPTPKQVDKDPEIKEEPKQTVVWKEPRRVGYMQPQPLNTKPVFPWIKHTPYYAQRN